MLQKLAKLLKIGRCRESEEPLPSRLSDPSPVVERAAFDLQPTPIERVEQPRTDRLHRVPLNKLGLFGPAWRQRLAALEIHSAAQFVNVSSEQWQQWGITDGEIRKLRRWAGAVRLASSMPSMKPYEAMMLFAIHRRRLSRLAGERPGRLQRDLLRFALSSRGKKLLRSRQVPDRQRVERWIEAARFATSASVSGTAQAVRSRQTGGLAPCRCFC